MRTSSNNLIKVIATGCVVLMLLSISLFWIRMILKSFESDLLSGRAEEVIIEPSGLVPDELENDPNVTKHSYIRANIDRSPLILGINLIQDDVIQAEVGDSTFIFGAENHLGIMQLYNQPPNIDYYEIDYKNEEYAYTYFDRSLGNIVYFNSIYVRQSDDNLQKKISRLYAGPKGVSEIPDEKIGKFYSPIIDISRFQSITLYDKKLRRFYDINLENKTVVEGPQLSKDDTHKPFQISTYSLSSNTRMDILDLFWNTPMTGRTIPSRSPIARSIYDSKYSLVLDETGRVDLLDREKLEFVGTAGYLPAPDTMYQTKMDVQPKDLMAYHLLRLTLDTDKEYKGMFAASLNRDGTGLALSVFDANGIKIATNHPEFKNFNFLTIESIYSEFPWGPTFPILKYMFENLQSPIFSVVSYFTADSFKAGSGHRALFILPNSYIAQKGRDTKGSFAERFLFAIFSIMLPSIMLSIFLIWRINKDAVMVGLSKNERLLWITGTIAFGLVAYITYRLTRPKEILVTCQNCGKPRRTDMDICHRCNSKWHVPELTPPLWRVIDQA